MESLKDKVVVITGAARGIGKTIAETMVSNGCRVVVSDIDREGIQSTAKSLAEWGGEVRAVVANVVNYSEAEALVQSTLEVFGAIDILVNNAGITRDNLVMRMKESDWDDVIAVNLKGTFNCIKAASRSMLRQRNGKIINISSVVGVMGNSGQANYAASKAGIIGMTKSVAKEFGSKNIRVNAVAPGYIETEMTRSLPESAKEAFLNSIPLKRAGSSKDVADAVAFLASDLSGYITGQVIHVDGGMVM